MIPSFSDTITQSFKVVRSVEELVALKSESSDDESDSENDLNRWMTPEIVQKAAKGTQTVGSTREKVCACVSVWERERFLLITRFLCVITCYELNLD